jgi:SAM-dependent methyltransferase
MSHGDEVVYYHNDESSSSILVRIFRRHIQGRVLEVGAGVGFVTHELAKFADSVVACEPTAELFSQLSHRVGELSNVEIRQVMTQDLVASARPEKFDTVVYFSVLEHIEDDADEVLRSADLLADGGRFLVLVPAHQWLYAKIDELSGHHRRYSHRTLRALFGTEFSSVEIRNFDTVGLLPYFIIFRLLRNTNVSGMSAKLYSKIVVRLSYLLYVITRGKLIGKNLLLVAHKK